MMGALKDTFKINNKDGVEVEYAVLMPNAQQFQDSNIHYRKTFARCMKEGVMLRAALERYMIEQGIWGAEKEKESLEIRHEIATHLEALAKGKIKMSVARDKALQIKRLRDKLRDLISEKTMLDNNTVEGQSDNSKFEFLVSECTVYNLDGARYFKDLDSYYSVGNDPVAVVAANKLMQMLYGVDSDYELNLPENQFLLKYKHVDDKLRLINKEGKLVDEEGRLVNEEGRYIDANGNFVDIFGNKLDEAGTIVSNEFEPFIDDETGEPVVV